MPKYEMLVTCVISETVLVEAENEEIAKERAREIFEQIEGNGRTQEYMIENVGELEPKSVTLIRGFPPEQLCQDHDMPRVYVGGRWKCERCEGAYAGTD